MASYNREIFRGGTVQFDVGEPSTSFSLHATLVSSLSEPLSLLISKHVPSPVRLENVDEATFTRFAEWAYTTNYSAAPPRKLDHDLDTESMIPEPAESRADEQEYPRDNIHLETVPEGSDDGWAAPVTGSKKRKMKRAKKASKSWWDGEVAEPPPIADALPEQDDGDDIYAVDQGPQHPHHPHHHYVSEVIHAISRIQIEPEPDLDFGPGYQYLDYFLSHAHLYVFADQHQIADLKSLTAGRFSWALGEFRYFNQRAEDIVALTEYVYANTRDDDDDTLRRALVAKLARHFEALVYAPVFGELLERGGVFVRDFCWKTAERLD